MPVASLERLLLECQSYRDAVGQRAADPEDYDRIGSRRSRACSIYG